MLVISSLELTPHRSTASATVRLPGGITDVDSCRPATIDLGLIPHVAAPATSTSTHPTRPMDPGCSATPAWSSRASGYVLDLSTTRAPRRGRRRGEGSPSVQARRPARTTSRIHATPATCAATTPPTTPSSSARASSAASIWRARSRSSALNPLGQTFTFAAGAMDVWYSQIVRGELRDGSTDAPGPTPSAPAGGTAGCGRRSPPSRSSPTSTSPAPSTTGTT